MSQFPQFVDYKDVSYLKGFLTPHARLTSSRRSDIPAGLQRKIKTAVKRARYMALLPFVAR